MLKVSDRQAITAIHSEITRCHKGLPVVPPLSPGCLWVCSTLPFDESSPPVCSMLPRIVPPFCTSSVPVVSLLVQTTSGVSRVTRVDAFTVTTGTVAVTESEAVTLAVLIPLIADYQDCSGNHLRIRCYVAPDSCSRIWKEWNFGHG